jgi:Na+(H+)/acetate symporter ActP
MNGFLKIPMQFVILFIGVMVFVFYQFFLPPVVFNKVQTDNLRQSEYAGEFENLEKKYEANFEESKGSYLELLDAIDEKDATKETEIQGRIKSLKTEQVEIRDQVKSLIVENDPLAETRDTDYVFMRFVMDNLPEGIIGLLFAVIFSAAMSSTASELNALGSTSTVDLYKRSVKKDGSDHHYLLSSKVFTAFWGLGAILFATYASLFENLIQAVNLLGSLFYGTILGIFMVGFFLKWVKGRAVFIAALLSEVLILFIHFRNGSGFFGMSWDIGFLWYNAIGCIAVMLISMIIQKLSIK